MFFDFLDQYGFWYLLRVADGFSVFGILAADPDRPVTILDVGVFSDINSAAAAAHNQARE